MIKKNQFINKHMRNASLILIGIQLFSLLTLDSQPQFKSTLISKSFLGNHYKYQQDETNKFVFSKKKNVIILVLDSFQSDLFAEIIKEKEKLAIPFEGFSYFRNAVSGYSVTTFATPFILTGKYFNPSLPLEAYLKQAYFSKSSIPKQLKDKGFSADIYPQGHFIVDPALVSNYQISKKRLFNHSIIHDLAQLYDIALFRASPHFFKKYIHNNNKLFLTTLAYNFNRSFKRPQNNKIDPLNIDTKSQKKTKTNENIEFLDDFLREFSTSSDQPVLKYYHISGLHPPLQMDENLNLLEEPLPISRHSFLLNTEAVLKLLRKFLEELKSQGIYDNSLIFIVGDHGSRYIATYDKDDPKEQKYEQSSIYTAFSSGVPLILVKPFNAKGPLKTSDSPVTLGDIGPTIFDELGMKHAERSMFKISLDNPTKRRFFLIMPQRPGHDFEFEEYEVTGFSWVRSSWKDKSKKATNRDF